MEVTVAGQQGILECQRVLGAPGEASDPSGGEEAFQEETVPEPGSEGHPAWAASLALWRQCGVWSEERVGGSRAGADQGIQSSS